MEVWSVRICTQSIAKLYGGRVQSSGSFHYCGSTKDKGTWLDIPGLPQTHSIHALVLIRSILQDIRAPTTPRPTSHTSSRGVSALLAPSYQ